MTTRAINICLHPNAVTNQEILDIISMTEGYISQQHISFLSRPNIPHLSLYHLCIENKHLTKIEEFLRIFVKRHTFKPFFLKNLTQTVGKNVFLESMNYDVDYKEILADLYKHVSVFKSDRNLPGVKIDQLNDIQKKRLHKYGVHYGTPDNFNPHFTLVYQLSQIIPIEIKIPSISFIPYTLSISEIEQHGNVINKIKEFVL